MNIVSILIKNKIARKDWDFTYSHVKGHQSRRKKGAQGKEYSTKRGKRSKEKRHGTRSSKLFREQKGHNTKNKRG